MIAQSKPVGGGALLITRKRKRLAQPRQFKGADGVGEWQFVQLPGTALECCMELRSPVSDSLWPSVARSVFL